MIGTIVSLVASAIAASSVQVVVTNIIKASSPIGMKLAERAFTTLGGVILTSVVTHVAMEPVNKAIVTIEKMVTKTKEHDYPQVVDN